MEDDAQERRSPATRASREGLGKGRMPATKRADREADVAGEGGDVYDPRDVETEEHDDRPSELAEQPGLVAHG